MAPPLQHRTSHVHASGNRIFVSGEIDCPYEGYPGGAYKHLIQLFDPDGTRQ